MRAAILTLLLIPFLSFGQLKKKDKKSIDKSAVAMCECVNDLMGELHPKTIEVVLLMAEKGEEDAMKDVEAMLTEMTPEEMQEFLASFTTMESEEFLTRIEEFSKISFASVCDLFSDRYVSTTTNGFFYTSFTLA